MQVGTVFLTLGTLLATMPHAPTSVSAADGPTGPDRVSAAHEAAAVSGTISEAEIPYFARRFGVSCEQCHVHPPKSNEFGEEFVRRGYRIPGIRPGSTWPFAIWATSRFESRSGAPDPAVHVNRVELISGGELTEWLSYFLEWRTISLESRPDGSLRDRSGRFEDLFLLLQSEGWEVMAGQFRSVQQVDVSRRLSLSEPVVLSASLPGTGGADTRRQALRGFSPSGRSPALRLARNLDVGGGWEWTVAAALPVPGEFSLPITREARTEASNELELRAKGVFFESFVRRGLLSFGGHVFYDDPRRYLAHAVATGSAGAVHWEAMAGGAKSGESLRGRWSVEGQYFPHRLLGAGARVENRAGDGAGVAFLPMLNVHFPGTRYTFRLTLEQRIQSGRDATLVEVGTVF